MQRYTNQETRCQSEVLHIRRSICWVAALALSREMCHAFAWTICTSKESSAVNAQRRSPLAARGLRASKRFALLSAFATSALLVNFLFHFHLDGRGTRRVNLRSSLSRKLAVVVPAHHGDLGKALASLSRWPTACSPSTLANLDLVLYYAQQPDEKSSRILPYLSRTGGRCFASTRVVYGNLTDEVMRTPDFCT